MTYSIYSTAAIEAALLAGKVLTECFEKTKKQTSGLQNPELQVHFKEGKKNLVTEADLLSERTILDCLKQKFPSHSFLSEEAGHSPSSSSEITWVIDPLDGTVNFAYNIPIFAISIAACQGEEVLTGVIFQPISSELFLAEKGKGAFLNGIPIHVSSEYNFENAFLATGFPYHVHENPGKCIDALSDLLHQGLHIRRLGAATLDLAYLAMGRFDAFFEIDLQPWDVAAGILLVQEAGGTVSDYLGKRRSPLQRTHLLASNPSLHPHFQKILHHYLEP